MNKRTVVVTGGRRGIGAAVVAAFRERGDRVIALDKDYPPGLAADEDNGFWTYGADVCCPEQVADFAEAVGKFGSIHVLVNNAGIGITKPLEELSVAEWDLVLNTNLRGPVLMVKYTLPLLKAAGKACVVNIASTRAFMSEPNTEAYSASKGGIVALTHALAASLGPCGIRVNCISPGWIETNPEAKLTPEDHSQHLVGRVGVPDDIARACIYLASPEAGFITGTNLTIDGGMTVKMIYV
ncbi:MAG: SDR family oxidoreductase [Limnochordia bacterium]